MRAAPTDLTRTARAYDGLAEIYDKWSAADPAWKPTADFYTALCADVSGPVVELCVGNGRLATEIAHRGTSIVGVDCSFRMLVSCLERARCAGLSNVHVVLQDVRRLALNVSTDLVIMPFRSIGHFLTTRDREAVFDRVAGILAPGGRFVFDHYVFSRSWAEGHDRVPRQLYFSQDEDGSATTIWDTYTYDFIAGRLLCVTTVEQVEAGGSMKRRHFSFDFAWMDPRETEELAIRAGFDTADVYGDFQNSPFTDTSDNQVWVLTKGKS